MNEVMSQEEIYTLFTKLNELKMPFDDWYFSPLSEGKLPLLGSGGFATVYEMHNRNLSRKIGAVKIFGLSQFETGKFDLTDFESEFKKQGDLAQDCSNIVDIHSVSILYIEYENGAIKEIHKVKEGQKEVPLGCRIIRFILMEKLEPVLVKNPKTFQKEIGPVALKGLSEQQILTFAKDIAMALKTAHEGSIIHRDVKLENTFYSKKDGFKLGDFGISRVMDAAGQASTKAGTNGYAAPEVSELGHYDGNKADIYSYGVMLYLLLNDFMFPFGTVPYKPQLAKQLSAEEFPEPLNGSQKFKALVLKATKKNPDERYSTFDEILKDLDEVAEKIDLPRRQQSQESDASLVIGETDEGTRTHVSDTEASAESAKQGEEGSTEDYEATFVEHQEHEEEAPPIKAEEMQKAPEPTQEDEAALEGEATQGTVESPPSETPEHAPKNALEQALAAFQARRAEEGELAPATGNGSFSSAVQDILSRYGSEPQGETAPSETPQATQPAPSNTPKKKKSALEQTLESLQGTSTGEVAPETPAPAAPSPQSGAQPSAPKSALEQALAGLSLDHGSSTPAGAPQAPTQNGGNQGVSLLEQALRSLHTEGSASFKTVTLGTYFYDESGTKKSLEWIVLEDGPDTQLLLSKDGIDCVPFDMTKRKAIWETSDVRRWLNESFLEDSFTGEEREKILVTNVLSDMNPQFGTTSGNGTQDRVFLLSIAEVQKYMSDPQKATCNPTPLAKQGGALESTQFSTKGHTTWVLRTPGKDLSSIANVHEDGKIDFEGIRTQYATSAIRPAIRVKK